MPCDGNPRFPFVEMPINSGPLRARGLVSDRVSWSDTPIFHNTLVVGSSPTSSTTQSHANRRNSCLGPHGSGIQTSFGRDQFGRLPPSRWLSERVPPAQGLVFDEVRLRGEIFVFESMRWE